MPPLLSDLSPCLLVLSVFQPHWLLCCCLNTPAGSYLRALHRSPLLGMFFPQWFPLLNLFLHDLVNCHHSVTLPQSFIQPIHSFISSTNICWGPTMWQHYSRYGRNIFEQNRPMFLPTWRKTINNKIVKSILEDNCYFLKGGKMSRPRRLGMPERLQF